MVTQLKIAVNPYEFWRARNARVAMSGYPQASCSAIFSSFKGTKSTPFFFRYQVGRGSTRRGKNHAHKTFDSTEASWYHQGSFSLILEKFEQIYDPLWGRRKTRSKITLKSFYSLKEFWHQASHLCIWKPMAWSSFLLTEFIYIGQLGQLLGRKKQ